MTRKLLFAFALLFCFSIQLKAQRPNIVVIITDDHTMQAMGAYGAKYGISPNMDRIAKEGVVFNRAFVTNSLCSPSRAALLTGKYSHINGHRDNHIPFNINQDLFVSRLQQAGYQTAWIGKWHLEVEPKGFDFWQVLPGQGSYYNPDFLMMGGGKKRYPGYCTDIITEVSLDWLNHRNSAQPFCLVIGQKATHRPWTPDIQDLGKLSAESFTVPENFYDDYKGRVAAARQNMSVNKTLTMGYDLKMVEDSAKNVGEYARMNPEQHRPFFQYYDSIRDKFKKDAPTGHALTEWKFRRYMQDYLETSISLDRNVGRIMDYLEQHKLLENTLVVYMSDQGFYLGEHGWFDKRFMYEESLRTPMLMRYPKLIRPGTSINEMVVNIDLAPTFLDLASAPVPADMQGQSMLPLLKGKKKGAKWREGVYYHYYEYPGEHDVYRHFGARSERYKLIRFYGEKDFWELYDLKKDPSEMNNCYNEPEYAAIVTAMKATLKELIVKYKDDEALKIFLQK